MDVRRPQVWAVIVVGLFASAAAAGTNSNFLDVIITLNNPAAIAPPPMISTPSRDVCVSETLSAQANALVHVICATGRFVTISPLPRGRFLGTHGSAFRYGLRQNTSQSIPAADEGDSRAGTLSRDVCVSETLSAQANALVHVICATEQFVTISPLPGGGFWGAHGSAFRYGLGQNTSQSIPAADEGDSRADMPADVPISRTDADANDSGGRQEVLISF
ncbi:MAG: hypothetical protein Q7K57_60720 [Burkholderiaceae bacterium]|nr:hypothetical protein [Burkholderiaceae bacterium]